MSRCVILICLTCLAVAGGCSEPIHDATCHRNDDCMSGRLCDEMGACVEAQALAITPRELDRALVGDGDYAQSMQATGGLPPYSWTMQPQSNADLLAWLEIDPTTGTLRARDGMAPTSAAADLVIDVQVLDRSNAGEGAAVTQPFTLSIVECKGDQTCFVAADGICTEGLRACSSEGVLSPDCTAGDASADAAHCGPDCGACPATANRCTAGLCRCGGGDPCDLSQACCGDGCFDLSSAQNHCGDCDTDCSALPHAQDPACTAGGCTYGACADGFLDCDDTPANGCETPVDIHNCSACGDRCDDVNTYAHTEQQACPAGACVYTCLPHFDSCDGDPGNGCETPLDTVTDCGQCDRACPDTLAGALCLGDADSGYACGCESDADCPADRMCCDALCVPHTENHCAACDQVCSILEGGLACTEITGPAWECQSGVDEDCRGIYPFSEARCSSGTNQCFCSATETCAGTTSDMCCTTDMVDGCVDLSSAPKNCGMCETFCAAGETCNEGACTCALNAGNCPANSGAPFCVNDACVCPSHENAPCLPGQTCCTGKGCCLDGCATPSDQCSAACNAALDVWCDWGCCPDCDSADQCDLHAP